MNPPHRMETIRNLHMAFFVSVREALADPNYVVRSGLTTPQGFFEFPEVPAGKYYLIVTFPDMVRDYKLAWQIPVATHDDETCRVVLNNDNLLLPTYSRSQPSRLNLERDSRF